jgi:hypothetical protein
VRDNAGNWTSEAYHVGPFYIDTVEPFVSIISPTEGENLLSSEVTVEWSGSDTLSGIDHYEVKLDSGGWIYKGVFTTHTFEDFTPGSHTSYVKAVDGAGNEAEDSKSFIVIGITPPRYTVVHGENNWDYFYQTYGPMLGAYYNVSETYQDYNNYGDNGLAERYTLVKINDNFYDLYITFGDMIGTWARVNDYFWDYYLYNATTGKWASTPTCTLQKIDDNTYRWWASLDGERVPVGYWFKVSDTYWDYLPIESFQPSNPYYLPTIFSHRIIIICFNSSW